MEKFIEISNALQVIVSEFGGTLMLELRGQFKPQRLSVGKIQFVLNHATKLHNLAQDAKEGHYTLDKDSSVILSKFQNVMMFELRGPFKPARISQNKLDAILGHQKELRQIIQDNTPETLVKDETVKAQKALKQNSASMPTDSKSAKDDNGYIELARGIIGHAGKQESAPVATGYKDGTLVSFVDWFVREYDATKEQARQWIDDKEYNAEFAVYLESQKIAIRPQKRVTPVRPVKRMTVEQMANGTEKMQESAKRIAELNAEIAQIETNGKLSPETIAMAKRLEKATGQKFDVAPTVQKTKKGRGIPVSFSVMTNIGKTNITRAASGIDAIRLLKGKTLIHPQTKETRLIDDRGENNSHWYATNVKDGYIFDVKRLNA